MPKKVTKTFVRGLFASQGAKGLKKAKRRGKYSAENVELLLTYVADIRKDLLKEFLKDRGLARSGSKEEIISRVKEAIDEDRLGHADLIRLLDATEPWGKQHTFLLDTRHIDPEPWTDTEAIEAMLREHGLDKCLNKHKPLLLPESLKVLGIESSETRFRVSAVERRVGYERVKEMDNEGENIDGDPVEYRAFVRVVKRGLIAFDWDLVANEAFLQISQLPKHHRYEHALKRFVDLVADWLPIADFGTLDLGSAILELRRMGKKKEAGVASHRVELEAPDGRRLAGSANSQEQPLHGNRRIDKALDGIDEDGGTGHVGDFFLGADDEDDTNPLAEDERVHIKVLGNRDRLNIMTPQREEVVRYAIRRVRDACD